MTYIYILTSSRKTVRVIRTFSIYYVIIFVQRNTKHNFSKCERILTIENLFRVSVVINKQHSKQVRLINAINRIGQAAIPNPR